MKIFVPGRLCLFGEHSDWAGGYRRVNPNVEKGYTLLVGTNQGLYAEVKANPTQLILHASLSNGTRKTLNLPMETEVLLAEAQKGGFWSYAAGVAYQLLNHYQVKGLEIDNYLTDLPIQKGLSSSAAICVLVARAFNRVYDLKMTVREEMEFAYLGEITTPSGCGRMDQACAYGNQPILMIFDGDRADVIELKIRKNLFFVIVDLGAGKNTQEILRQLNQCYPLATNAVQQNVQKYLGSISSQITLQAVDALQKGDAEEIGTLMQIAQTQFDKHLIPACPSQLTAPILHQILNYEPLKPYILGGKGVGSQGDGTVQFIVKDEESQQQVIEIIKRDFPQMQALSLTVNSDKKIRKAVIPAGGFGTRLFPATKAVKKELFPIIDNDGRAKPVIMAIVEEAISGGIEEVGIVVQPSDRALFEDFFKAPLAPELYKKLSPQNQEYSQYLQDLGSRITILNQDKPEGYGYAVFCAKEWVKDEPFLLMLGDHVYSSDTETSCAGQILDIYEQVNQSVVSLTTLPAESLYKSGCVTGNWQELNSILSVTQLSEKPTIEYALQHLRVEGMAEDQFLCIFGLYVLTPKIFDFLEENINNNTRDEKGEFQLTSCLDKLCKEEGMTGYVVKGKCYDTGLPDPYRQTMIDFRNV
ncbi:GHMP kinase [Trichocoleus sp. FACHB-69]|uniref:sugar phosphate nucleotidyltransferase n=2 Tax=Cyanophyceae TaxID=3028117 RepID=UPI00168714F2|nr:sugar phosphate nucleotidyltransferase [Trichocoleus sp. FACHB-69]MBD1935033.1 GHMP kinase [Trichocoleus sp. FACHB-69]